MAKREVSVRAYPRVHICLLSLHADAPRINGGIGFAISDPTVLVTARAGASLSVSDERSLPMPAAELEQLLMKLRELFASRSMWAPVELVISGNMRTHVGMGSATAIRLAALEAFASLNGEHISRDELIKLSGRGGTSGVGISTYFNGGLICDLGKAPDEGGFLPSSRATVAKMPLQLAAVHMQEWSMVLCVPRWIEPKTQAEELHFFRTSTPLQAQDSYEATYHALCGPVAAALEQDYVAFCRGIRSMQSAKWKVLERRQYGERLVKLEERLYADGADCVGMSSFGPLLYCFVKPSRVPNLIQGADKYDCDVIAANPINSGRIIDRQYA